MRVTYEGDPHELWKCIGHALWTIQVMEYAVAHYITLLDTPRGNPEDAFSKLEKAFEKTLGQLVRKLRKRVKIEESFDKRLAKFIDERNWLAHRVWREGHNDIYSAVKFQKLINRLIALEQEALFMSRSFAKLCEKWCLSKGIKKEEFEAEAKRIYKEWTKT